MKGDRLSIQPQKCESCLSNHKSVFCRLPEGLLSLLNDSKQRQGYKKGHVFFEQNEQVPFILCIEKGSIKLEVHESTGTVRIIRILKDGDVLGLMSFFLDAPTTARAVATEDCQVCLIPRNLIHKFIGDCAEFNVSVLKYISESLRATESRLIRVMNRDVTERICESILILKHHFNHVQWTRREIAEWAGTTTETVIRTLAILEKEKLISLNERQIQIENREGLINRARLTEI